MSGIGVIINPRSRRNLRGLTPLRTVLARHSDAAHAEIEDVSEIPSVLSGFAERGVELVAISGGDGTVQAVITALLNNRLFAVQPDIALLPSGMTNLIATNVGLHGRPERALARLLASGAGFRSLGRRRSQAVLSLRRTPQEAPIHGLFLGTAVFHRLVVMAHREVHPWGVERHLAIALSMAVALMRLVLNRDHSSDIWHGDPIRLDLDEQAWTRRDYLLFLATTLDRLMMGINPFWGSGDGPLRCTTVEYPAPQLGRAVLPLIRGTPRPWFAEAGYLSGRATECRLELSCPIVFDGEIVCPDPAVPVSLRADQSINFWQEA
jgi:diacylglycerol kinase family enzyme